MPATIIGEPESNIPEVGTVSPADLVRIVTEAGLSRSVAFSILSSLIGGIGGIGGSGTVFKHLRSIASQTFINGNNDFQIYNASLAEPVTNVNSLVVLLTQTGTLALLETFLATITSIVVDTVDTFNSGNEVTLAVTDIYDSTENEFLIADISALGWDGDSDLYLRIVCDEATENISGQVWLDLEDEFSLNVAKLQNYETPWTANSDWTNFELTVNHGLGGKLEDLLVKFLISSSADGSGAFEPRFATQASPVADSGMSFYYVDDDNLKVQTGAAGLEYVGSGTGGVGVIDTESWYYKVVVYKLR